MDKTDLVLAKLLLANSRLPYRSLAEMLGLSVNAVHRRIKSLRESGVIEAFTAKISLSALGAISVLVFGESHTHLTEAVLQRLGANRWVYWVAAGGGNFLLVGIYLREISELQEAVAFVQREAAMPEPTVGIVHQEAPSPAKRTPETKGRADLRPLDFRIIHALRRDSRRPLSDVAEELGVSAKTVRRRLSRMMEKGLIEFSMRWFPHSSNDIITVFNLVTRPPAEPAETGRLLMQKYSPNVIFFLTFGNLPNRILSVVWTSTMKELHRIRESIQRESFESVVPNILYTGGIFDTWRDELPLKRGWPPVREDP